MKVRDILTVKGSRVVTIEPTILVLDAMRNFHTNRVGSLVVVDKHDAILGILAAKDVLMAVVEHFEGIQSMTVDKVMTTNLIVGDQDDNTEYILAVMTENRVRHIPIIDGNKLKGIVSIGDIVKSQMLQKDVENKYLKDYIADKYPG